MNLPQLIIALVVASVLPLSQLACKRLSSEPSNSTTRQKPPAPPVLPILARIQRGICLAHNWQFGGLRGYGSAASLKSKQELKRLGARWLSLTPFGWQRTLDARMVKFSPNHRAGENDRRLEAEIIQARKLGFKIMLKPHIWVSYSKWRGEIKPSGANGWQTWFESYRRFILHHARLAQRLKVEAFVIGVEFKSSSATQHAEWLKTIAAVRKVYRGRLTYAANWDEVQQIRFWNKLDWIGIQFFAPLTRNANPKYGELQRAIHGYLTGYQRISKRFNKPLLFTEMGYKSVVATAVSPHSWPEHLPKSQRHYSESAQALAYRAFFNTVGQSKHVAGVYVWKWFTNVDTNEEGRMGFSPRRKLAAIVLKRAFRLPSKHSGVK